MKFEEHRQRYIAEKAVAEGNIRLVEAEVERLKEVVLRLNGAIAATDELEQVEAEELANKEAKKSTVKPLTARKKRKKKALRGSRA